MELTLTREELKRIREGQTREMIVKEGFWWMRPDDVVFRPPTETKTGVFYILEFKRMSDVTDQYLLGS